MAETTTPNRPLSDRDADLCESEAIDIIRDEARAVALSFGVRACDEAAAALVDRVRTRLAGSRVYLAKQSALDRRRRQAEMLARFDGKNLEALASEYRISPRHARRLVAFYREKAK